MDLALEEGRYQSASVVAAALGITGARVSQVMALLRLPPKAQEAVLLMADAPSARTLRAVSAVVLWTCVQQEE